MKTSFAACALTLVGLSSVAMASDLLGPRPIMVGNRLLDIEHSGHAAPAVGDFDGDGVQDLLVGEFYKGRLGLYRNIGTNAQPRFASMQVFQDGAPGGCVAAS